MLEFYGRYPTTATTKVPYCRHCHWSDRRSSCRRTCVFLSETDPCSGASDDGPDDSRVSVSTGSNTGTDRPDRTGHRIDVYAVIINRNNDHDTGARRRVTKAASLSSRRHGAILFEQRLSVRGSTRSEASLCHHGRGIYGLALSARSGLHMAGRTWRAASCDGYALRTNAGRDARHDPREDSFSARSALHARRHRRRKRRNIRGHHDPIRSVRT